MSKTTFLTLPDWLACDINWLATTPGLLANVPRSLNLIRETCTDLQAGILRFECDHLIMLKERRLGPLGRYFEALVQTIISCSPDVKHCHRNVLIHDGNRTRGELDLVYEYAGQWIHLELAVKYYLGTGDLSNPFQWYGPAARDTLGRKLGRLFDHQLCLPATTYGRAVLDSLEIDAVHSEPLVMGMLFHPFEAWKASAIITPDTIAADHPVGWWLRSSDAEELGDIDEWKVQALSKPEWLSSPKQGQSILQPLKELLCQLKDKTLNFPVMLLSIDGGGNRHRGFIVPDEWSPLAI
jgi:hypothetical protein